MGSPGASALSPALGRERLFKELERIPANSPRPDMENPIPAPNLRMTRACGRSYPDIL
jgi:hypothetical protein